MIINPKEISKTYKLEGKVVKLMPNNKAKIFIKTANNNSVKKSIILKVEPEVYGELLCALNYWIVVEMRNGVITDFIGTTEDDRIILDSNNKIINLILQKSVNKKRFLHLYSNTLNCCTRTAERHLTKAIDEGLVKQKEEMLSWIS